METRDGREIQMSRPARVSRAWGGGRSGKTKQQGFTAKGLLPPPPTKSTATIHPLIPLPPPPPPSTLPAS